MVRRDLVPITEVETTRLIAASSPDQPLRLAFGTAGAALEPGQAWALRLLIEWRGITIPARD